jgi:uncharacterized protein YndB with AHSA1/START domain
MLKKILLVIVLLAAGVLVYAATRPDTFRIERRAEINAPADVIYPLISDFHEWPKWSPWEELDPAMTRTHSGAPNGRGAVYEWAGNSEVGRGRMEITDAVPSSSVTIALDFMEPWEAHNLTEFRLTPAGSGPGTLVTWTMEGPSPYLTKLMGVFVNMDRMIGSDFERGLDKLARVAGTAR